MAKKRINRNQRQLYSTPLPLPSLAEDGSTASSQRVAAATGAAITTATTTTCQCHCKGWTTLDTLAELVRGMVDQVTRWCSSSKSSHLLTSTTTTVASKTSSAKQRYTLAHAEFHPQGEAVWITDPESMQRLFRQGFFGKGTLSRSEATWSSRQQEKLQGTASPNLSLEDITRKRRIERAALKEEKRLASAAESPQASGSTSASQSPTPSSVPSMQASVAVGAIQTSSLAFINDIDQDSVEDLEHLQLSLEEAFFLVFAIEAIAVYRLSDDTSSKGKDPMTIHECWHQFAMASLPDSSTKTFSIPQSPLPFGWDNPFIVRYVAYHHYRSHGWVVKDGLKYGVDFLLYRKGVVFGHSEYAVKVISGSPSSEEFHHPTVSQASLPISPRPIMGKVDPWHHPVYSWRWLLNLNRVVSQVQKTLLLCHVLVPQDTSRLPKYALSDPRLALPQYTVVEVTSRRWIPERNRA